MKLTNLFAILLAALVANNFSARAWSDTFGIGANTFNIDFVTIGNPGNLPDTTGNPNPAGAVPYTYRMGTYEISEQMIDKANTLGGLLITKDTRSTNKPATNISWNEAARFVNWLNTSTGSPPAYKFAVQPGEGGYSSNASIQLWTPSDAGYNPNNLYRNNLARYFLPSTDEWYKAAYYDPTSGVYYDYPTGSNSVPDGIDFAGDPNFDAVFADGGTDPQPHDITLAGLPSPYGTIAQGGNVRESEESSSSQLNNNSSSARGLRGGDGNSGFGDLSSSIRSFMNPAITGNDIGFRVASNIPEPSTPLLAAMASVGLLLRRRASR